MQNEVSSKFKAHSATTQRQTNNGTDNNNWEQCSAPCDRLIRPSEHVVSHIMRRVAEYDTATEVRLLLRTLAGEPHWQQPGADPGAAVG